LKEAAMLNIRPATLNDLSAITAIYNHAILHTVATFDTEVKTDAEQEAWFAHHGPKYPVVVAELDTTVVGWASLSQWSDRCAYEDTAEISLYVDEKFQGRGIGKALLQRIIREGETAGLHTVIARIAAGNDVSIYLHQSVGFEHIGIMREVGRKFGQLLDVTMMQKVYPSRDHITPPETSTETQPPASDQTENRAARYHKIVVPLDGSGWAERAVSHAAQIAKDNEAELILLHVYHSPLAEYSDALALADQADLIDRERDEMKRYLIGLRNDLRSQGVKVRGHILNGRSPAHHICNYVRNEGADLVVMSTHGRTGLARFLYGGVANKVMHDLDVPVMLVRPDKPEEQAQDAADLAKGEDV
jgi:phosphinothricin acetyltransferase